VRRYPYHRYLTYQLLRGDQDVIEHMRELEYIPPLLEDVEEMRASLRRKLVNRALREKMGITFFDEKSKSVDQVFWIVETPVVRTCAERMLLDKIEPANITTVLSLKFNHRLTKKAVELFRDGFWDTALLTNYDFHEYFLLGHQSKPAPPPDTVSLKTRPSYTSWKQGLHPTEEELSPDVMIREIQVDAFMRFKESADPKAAKGWADLVLKTAPARKALADFGEKGNEIPGIRPVLEYPEQSVPTIADLHTEYSERQSGTGAAAENIGSRDS